MSTSIDALHLRRTWGRDAWAVPTSFGPDGWSMISRGDGGSIIVTCADYDGAEWIHASIAWHDRLPTYDELKTLHASVWKRAGYSYQCFVPPSDHVNIHEHALHLWGRADGKPVLPNFGAEGSI